MALVMGNFHFRIVLVAISITQLHSVGKEGNEANIDDDEYEGCIYEMWDTRDMTADDAHSLFLLSQRSRGEITTYHLTPFITQDGKTYATMRHNEQLLFICGSEYHEREVNSNTKLVLKCINGNLYPEDFKILPCRRPAKPMVREVEKLKCGKGNDKQLYEIGYKIYPQFLTQKYQMRGKDSEEMDDDLDNVFYPFIEICVNVEHMSTVYTSHTIDGKMIAARQKLSSIPQTFSMDGYNIEDEYSFQTIYDPDLQQERFYTLMGDKSREYFDNEYFYFVPRQLTPDYDMLTKNWKTVTHYFMNTVPQWQSVTSTLDTLEDLIRRRAAELKSNVMVFTGTHGQLRLNEVNIHLLDAKIPVPKYFWKIAAYVTKKKQYSAIAFVISNHPHNDDDIKKLGLTNICDTTGWTIGITNPELGTTVCCTVQQLVDKFDIELVTQAGKHFHAGEIGVFKMFY